MGYDISRQQARILAYEMTVKNEIKIPESWNKA